MDAVPEGIDPAQVHRSARTAHLVCPDGWSDTSLARTRAEPHQRFGIGHTTLQVERGDHGPCAQAPAEVV